MAVKAEMKHQVHDGLVVCAEHQELICVRVDECECDDSAKIHPQDVYQLLIVLLFHPYDILLLTRNRIVRNLAVHAQSIAIKVDSSFGCGATRSTKLLSPFLLLFGRLRLAAITDPKSKHLLELAVHLELVVLIGVLLSVVASLSVCILRDIKTSDLPKNLMKLLLFLRWLLVVLVYLLKQTGEILLQESEERFVRFVQTSIEELIRCLSPLFL